MEQERAKDNEEKEHKTTRQSALEPPQHRPPTQGDRDLEETFQFSVPFHGVCVRKRRE